MLTQLSIRNIVLIDKLDIAFDEGLVALTGETGAGKSILLDSLGLGLGERGEASLVRTGAQQASVTLTFVLPKKHALHVLLKELELREQPENTLIMRRVLGADGRSRAFVDDAPVSVSTLKKIGDMLVEIHGQFETHGLLNRETHLGFLDAFANIDTRDITALYAQWRESETLLENAKGAARQAAREAEVIHAARDELQKLNPQSGEAEVLADKRARLQSAEKIMEALAAALSALDGDGGATQRAGTARRILLKPSEKAPELLNPVLEALARAGDALAESSAALESLLNSDDFDHRALENIEDRLFALRAAARKYQCTPDDLCAYLQKLNEQAALIQNSDATLASLEKDCATHKKNYHAMAHALHEYRIKAARALEQIVHTELPPLKLDKAKFVVLLEKLDEGTALGLTRVTFLASTNPGQPPGPIHKNASGGELARFMLALRLCLATQAQTTTLVFDEVDTGIGGATANAVGQRLARLAGTLQTLVVTHSPQVAAKATHHLRVEKHLEKGTMVTSLTPLEGEERLEEIARMLAGHAVTDAARAAAATLLSENNTRSGVRRKVEA